MRILFLFLFVLLFAHTDSFAQQNDTISKKTIQAVYVETAPKIDGSLDEDVWKNAPIAAEFTENEPYPNTPSDYKTEVKVVYTTEAIYVGAKMYDSSGDSVLRQLSVRDRIWSTNADNFAVLIDGMHTEQNFFEFVVTAAGVQGDASDGDYVWDAVWKSNTQIVDDGWIAEFEIPYSQLRFPRSSEQTWGINFARSVRRTREFSFWNKVNPQIDGFSRQFGLLKGIEKIKPPIRLSMTPYAAFYLQHTDDNDPSTRDWRPFGSAGADLKYGINESFTLDVALVPDFGDTQSDNFQFNLSPFEIYYEERRPFFTESIQLFQKADIFYSRRVGSRPTRYNWAEDQVGDGEELIKNPVRPQLVNALKVSGRTKKGLGIGLFNAITAPTKAQIQDSVSGDIRKLLTEPLTNYNVIVFDQQFRDNSYFSLINTSVFRPGKFTDAIVTGTDFRISFLDNSYAISGNGALSQQFLDTALHSQSYRNGYRYNLEFGKVGGNVRVFLRQAVASKQFDPNDLGFNTVNNYLNHQVEVAFNQYQPVWIYNSLWGGANIRYNMLYNPNAFVRAELNYRINGTFRNFLSAGLSGVYQPWGFHDYFEPRTDGRFWDKPAWSRFAAWFSSDYRKPFALDGNFSYRSFAGRNDAWNKAFVLQGELMPIIRFSDRLNMNIMNNTTVRNNNIGYVNTTDDGSIIFGARYRQDMINQIEMTYLFTNRMALSLRVRHYWGLAEYSKFYELADDGTLLTSTYNDNHNQNFNAFNL
ncbi:MAG: carbohydrate binding family 9 domain-containing protein, partial [Saprospiraceae bacterium]|nr:carbohydrate binding family 9 domain-containing protein [Saprospiraceae bacterium]